MPLPVSGLQITHQAREPVNEVMAYHHFSRSISGTNLNFIPCLELDILGGRGVHTPQYAYYSRTKVYTWRINWYVMIVGFGTSHGVNNILLQRGTFADARAVLSPKRKCFRRSLRLPESVIIWHYLAGKWLWSKPLKFYTNHTTWKVSVFWVILVFICPHLDWIRWDTPYLSVFSPNAGKSGPEQPRIQKMFT